MVLRAIEPAAQVADGEYGFGEQGRVKDGVGDGGVNQLQPGQRDGFAGGF